MNGLVSLRNRAFVNQIVRPQLCKVLKGEVKMKKRRTGSVPVIGLRPKPGDKKLPENVDTSLRSRRFQRLIAPIIEKFHREQKTRERTQYLNLLARYRLSRIMKERPKDESSLLKIFSESEEQVRKIFSEPEEQEGGVE